MAIETIGVFNGIITALQDLTSTQVRPGLYPIPGTTPLTVEAAILPPVLYYVALLFLPPAPPPLVEAWAVKVIRNITALIAGVLFLRLPLAYHVPQSIGLTYQLGLVGIYGGLRVLDAFFVSAFWFDHIPRRVAYVHDARLETPVAEHPNPLREWTDGGVRDPYHHSEYSNVKPSPSRTTSWDMRSVQSSQNGAPMSSSSSSSSARANSSTGKNGTTQRKSIRPSETAPEVQTTEINAREAQVTAAYLLQKTLSGPKPIPVYETAKTEDAWPHSFPDRASWALELELSMRGQGFTWTTADVRHTRKTWLPTLGNRVHSILVHVLPIQFGAWFIISTVYKHYLAETLESPLYDPIQPQRISIAYHLNRRDEVFDQLPTHIQLLLTAALGAFLMAAFSLGHSIFAVMLHPLSPHPLAFFPPLYTTRVWSLTSVRKFWSFGWHRLFARLFLVWGVWPGEWIERKITGKRNEQPADVGKVIGAFVSSAFVHAFSVRGVLGGRWDFAAGEMRFFLLNGLLVVFEGAVMRTTKMIRMKMGWNDKMWYDEWIGRIWWTSAILWSGREFARGWVKSSLVREMAFK